MPEQLERIVDVQYVLSPLHWITLMMDQQPVTDKAHGVCDHHVRRFRNRKTNCFVEQKAPRIYQEKVHVPELLCCHSSLGNGGVCLSISPEAISSAFRM